MKRPRKPKRIFRVKRLSPKTAVIEPDVHGPVPHYRPIVRKALLDLESKVGVGEVYQASIYHDDWCAVFTGGSCNCRPDVKVERIH